MNRKRTDNTMPRGKQTTGQTMIYKTQHIKLNIEQHESHQKTGVNLEGLFIQYHFSNISIMCHVLLPMVLYSINYFVACFVVDIWRYRFNVEMLANHLSHDIVKQLLKVTIITTRSYLHSCFIAEFLTRVARWVSTVVQGTVCPVRTPEFTPCVVWGRCFSIFSFPCSVL